jgi:hypothetical protein
MEIGTLKVGPTFTFFGKGITNLVLPMMSPITTT